MRTLPAIALALAGLARAAAAAVDPGQDGPFAVGSATLALEDAARARTLQVELWYPAQAAGRDATPRSGRFRLILLAHGHCGSRTNYSYLAAPLASYGFVVAAPGLPGVQAPDCDGGLGADPQGDLAFVRDVLRDRAGAAADWARHVRRGKIGFLGHSFGGFFGLRAAQDDPDVRVLALLAPFTGAVEGSDLDALRPRRPVLVVGGTADTRIPFETSQLFFDALPRPAFLVKIEGGTHSGFGDDALPDDPVAIGRQQELTRRYVIAFLRRHLAGDARFGRFLRPEDAASQGDDVELEAH